MAGANADQATYWNSDAAQTWIRLQPVLDEAFVTVTDMLLTTAAPAAGERVLDIGCGAGATTLAVAKRVGPGGTVTGIDISEPLLDVARQRARARGRPGVTFVLADAQTYPFPPDGHDLVVSRFGSMFFEDPVAALANLRTTLRRGGRMALVAWAGMAVNPWFTVGRDAVVAVLGPGAPTSPTAPGPLAFADIARVEGILRDAGLDAVQGREVTSEVAFAGTVGDVSGIAVGLGPAARLIREKEASRDQVAEIVRGVEVGLRPYERGGAVRLPAVLTLFTASRA